MSDNTWYYVDRRQQRQGPVTADALREAVRRGDADGASLAWREGLAQWTPLAQLFDELGITPPAAPAAPPPVVAAPVAPAAPVRAPLPPGTVVPGGFLRRWAALFIDSLLLGFAFYVVFFILVLVAGLGMGAFEPGASDTGATLLVVVAYLVYPLMSLAYFVGMERSSLQATVGKLALGIKVVDEQGRRLGAGRALGRWFATLLSYLTLYIGFLMALFTDRKRTLHDMVSGTQVVDRWAYTDQPDRQMREPSGCLVAAGVVLALFLVVSVVGILAAIALPAYQDYVHRAKVASVVASAGEAKLAVSDFVANTERCPRDAEELGLEVPEVAGLDDLQVGSFEDGLCGIELRLGSIGTLHQLEGRHVWFTREEDGRWTCSTDFDNDKYLPATCR